MVKGVKAIYIMIKNYLNFFLLKKNSKKARFIDGGGGDKLSLKEIEYIFNHLYK